MSKPEELIVLVDPDGKPIGTAPKLASHHAHTPLHKAFSCYIFDTNGKFLVTQRAKSKKVWPGVWTNSVCGHPGPDESDEHAIARRARDEIGLELTDIQVALPDYRYTTPPYNGIIENEICPVYVARAASKPTANSEEVEAYEWMFWESYADELAAHPDQYSYWAKDQFSLLQDSKLLADYTQPQK